MSTKLQNKHFFKDIAPTVSVGSVFIVSLFAIALVIPIAVPVTAMVSFGVAAIVNTFIAVIVIYFVVEAYKRHKSYSAIRLY